MCKRQEGMWRYDIEAGVECPSDVARLSPWIPWIVLDFMPSCHGRCKSLVRNCERCVHFFTVESPSNLLCLLSQVVRPQSSLWRRLSESFDSLILRICAIAFRPQKGLYSSNDLANAFSRVPFHILDPAEVAPLASQE